MPHRPRFVALLLAALLTPTGVQALDLSQALAAARQHDTAVNFARLQADAARERLPQSNAALLPALDANLGAAAGSADNDLQRRQHFDNVSGVLNLAIPIYRPASRAAVDQARIGIEIAELQLDQALQELVTRVGAAYFDVLAAQDTIEVTIAQRRAINEQFNAARRNFDVGNATATDQQEAQARLDLNAAQLAGARSELEVRRSALSQLTGVPSEEMGALKLDTPLPDTEGRPLEAWVARARENAYPVRLQQRVVATARREFERARHAHSPTLDLVSQAAALQGRSATTAWSGIDRSTSVTAGLQLRVPLYAGGALSARERETATLLAAAEVELETARRNAEQQARQAWHGLVASSEQARALVAAVASSRLALESNLLGYQVGVRVNMDVLNALQQLYQAFRDLARARYDVLLNGLRLQAATGDLQAERIEQLNGLLTAPGTRTFPIVLPPALPTLPPAGPGRALPPPSRPAR